MNVGKGHWIFALVFIFIFVLGMLWAYRSDLQINRLHYKGSYKIIFGIISVLLVVYLFVRLKTGH